MSQMPMFLDDLDPRKFSLKNRFLVMSKIAELSMSLDDLGPGKFSAAMTRS